MQKKKTQFEKKLSKTFANRLSSAIDMCGVDRKTFSNQSGLSYTSILNWTNYGVLPKADKLVLLSKQLCVSVDWLLGLTDEQ